MKNILFILGMFLILSSCGNKKPENLYSMDLNEFIKYYSLSNVSMDFATYNNEPVEMKILNGIIKGDFEKGVLNSKTVIHLDCYFNWNGKKIYSEVEIADYDSRGYITHAVCKELGKKVEILLWKFNQEVDLKGKVIANSFSKKGFSGNDEMVLKERFRYDNNGRMDRWTLNKTENVGKRLYTLSGESQFRYNNMDEMILRRSNIIKNSNGERSNKIETSYFNYTGSHVGVLSNIEGKRGRGRSCIGMIPKENFGKRYMEYYDGDNKRLRWKDFLERHNLYGTKKLSIEIAGEKLGEIEILEDMKKIEYRISRNLILKDTFMTVGFIGENGIKLAETLFYVGTPIAIVKLHPKRYFSCRGKRDQSEFIDEDGDGYCEIYLRGSERKSISPRVLDLDFKGMPTLRKRVNKLKSDYGVAVVE